VLKNPVAVLISAPGKVDSDKARALHEDACSIAMGIVIGELEHKCALQAQRTSSGACRGDALQRHRLIEKLDSITTTGVACVLYGVLSSTRPKPPERHDCRRHSQQQRTQKKVS
jgi:hypothetical protein